MFLFWVSWCEKYKKYKEEAYNHCFSIFLKFFLKFSPIPG